MLPETSADYLRLFKVVLAVKYGTLAVEGLVRIGRNIADEGFVEAIAELGSVAWAAHYSAIAACVGLVLWLRRDRPSYGMPAMALILAHAVITILHREQLFANHHLLQALIGLLGLLSVARQRFGETVRRAWSPVAWLVVVLWGVAGAKKLLHGAYHDGEFLASLADGSRRTLFALGSRVLLEGPDGDAAVGGSCCFTGPIEVAAFAGWILVVAGIGMALAEMSPVIVSRVAPRAVTGWLMLGLSVIATSIANEMDFGMVLVALAALWGEGRRFRVVSVLIALGMAAGHLWTVLR